MKTPVFHPLQLPAARARARTAFTLLEMIVAMSVVAIAMLVVVEAMSRVQETWRMTNTQVREAQDARAALEAMSRTITRATLNGRWKTDDASAPSLFLRDSDLHFVCGPCDALIGPSSGTAGHAVFFQAPLGHSGPDERTGTGVKAEYDTLPGVLNAWGYFVEFAEDPAALPSFIAGDRRSLGLAAKRHRFRLMEYRQPAHELDLFQMDGSDPPESKFSQLRSQNEIYQWFTTPLKQSGESTRRRCAVIADNVLAVIIEPQKVLASEAQTAGAAATLTSRDEDDYLYDTRRYQWDSGSAVAASTRHRLPQALKLTVIVLDERDWDKLTEDQALRTGAELRNTVAGLFHHPAGFTSDIGAVTGELNRRRMHHRVITTTIQMPAGRWTTDDEGR